jgi:hypothetical protein
MTKLIPILIGIGFYLLTSKKKDEPTPTPTPTPRPKPDPSSVPPSGTMPGAGNSPGGGATYSPGGSSTGSGSTPANLGPRIVRINGVQQTPVGISTANGKIFIIAKDVSIGINMQYQIRVVTDTGSLISANPIKLRNNPQKGQLKSLLLDWAKANSVTVLGYYNW